MFMACMIVSPMLAVLAPYDFRLCGRKFRNPLIHSILVCGMLVPVPINPVTEAIERLLSVN